MPLGTPNEAFNVVLWSFANSSEVSCPSCRGSRSKGLALHVQASAGSL